MKARLTQDKIAVGETVRRNHDNAVFVIVGSATSSVDDEAPVVWILQSRGSLLDDPPSEYASTRELLSYVEANGDIIPFFSPFY